MTNVEIRMTKEARMTKLEAFGETRSLIWPFVIGSFVILSTFGIRTSSFLCAAEPCQPLAGEAELVPVIVNGQVTDDFPAVGVFHTKFREKPATATLIGKRTVLTAAHCIDDGFKHTIELGGKLYEMESAVRHPEFVVNNGDLNRMDPFDRADHDLAIVRLKEAPPVAAAMLNTSRLARGQALVVVGFGETELNKNDRGTKRRAQNFIDRITPNKLEFRGPQSVCHGDSGGPSFAQFQGQMLLVGVHSVVSNPCGRFGVDMRVDFYLDWIRQTAGDDVLLGPAAPER
jgi:V8-like Glu-specific endopeptidase